MKYLYSLEYRLTKDNKWHRYNIVDCAAEAKKQHKWMIDNISNKLRVVKYARVKKCEFI